MDGSKPEGCPQDSSRCRAQAPRGAARLVGKNSARLRFDPQTRTFH